MSASFPPGAPGDRLDRVLGPLLVVFALAAPWSIAGAQMATILAALSLLVARLARRRRALSLPWTLWAVLGFLLAQAISIPLGIHPERSLRCFRGSWVILFVFVYWQALREPTLRRQALHALIGSAALAGLYGTWQHWGGIDLLHRETLEPRPEGGFIAVGNLNSHLTYAGVLLPVFFLAIGAAIGARGRGRGLLGLAAALIGSGLLFSFTRTAWIGAAVGVSALGLLLGRRAALIGGGTLGGVLVGGALLSPALAQRLVSIFQSGDDPRWRLWQTALHIVRDHPITGAGLGAFKTLFPTYKVPGWYMSTIHPHHDLLNHMVEAGIVGGIAWIAIWLCFLAETRRTRFEPLRIGAIAGVLALLGAGLGQCYSTDEEVAQVWWFVVALGLHEAGVSGERRRTPLRALSKGLKAWSLPLLALLFAGRGARRSGVASAAGTQRSERILLLRPDNRLGNLILLSPFLRRLREARPEAEISFLVGDEYAETLRSWPWFDHLLIQDKRRQAREPWRFAAWMRGLRGADWNLVFELSNHNTHSYYNCALALLSGAPERVGFFEPRNRSALTHAVPAPEAEVHFSLAPLRLLRSLGMEAAAAPLACPLAGEPGAALSEWLHREGLLPRAAAREERERFLLLHLGGRNAKAWSLDAWAEVLPGLGERWPGRIVVMAGPEERERLAPISRTLRSGFVTAPPVGARDLAFLLRAAAGFVGCDSGVMHLSVACDTPTVALFFRSNPYHYAPLGQRHQTVLLANPYGVEEAHWARSGESHEHGRRPDTGLGRSRLWRAESDPVSSLRGEPAVDRRAVEAVIAATLTALTTERGNPLAGSPPSRGGTH
ncbi:MAG: O-antigen ligase family protein [Candidatus Eisenbacteria bacterium]|nr:O-antigen ligase family protein [Candidatus Eisenbacteria bacterium]